MIKLLSGGPERWFSGYHAGLFFQRYEFKPCRVPTSKSLLNYLWCDENKRSVHCIGWTFIYWLNELIILTRLSILKITKTLATVYIGKWSRTNKKCFTKQLSWRTRTVRSSAEQLFLSLECFICWNIDIDLSVGPVSNVSHVTTVCQVTIGRPVSNVVLFRLQNGVIAVPDFDFTAEAKDRR